MTLTILSPFQTVADARVDSLTVPGGAGSFTVLRNHAPIISTLTPGVVSWRLTDGGTGELNVEGGMVYVEDNDIKIFI